MLGETPLHQSLAKKTSLAYVVHVLVEARAEIVPRHAWVSSQKGSALDCLYCYHNPKIHKLSKHSV